MFTTKLTPIPFEQLVVVMTSKKCIMLNLSLMDSMPSLYYTDVVCIIFAVLHIDPKEQKDPTRAIPDDSGQSLSTLANNFHYSTLKTWCVHYIANTVSQFMHLVLSNN